MLPPHNKRMHADVFDVSAASLAAPR